MDKLWRILRVIGLVLAGLLLALVVFLWVFDWNAARGTVGRVAGHLTGREVRIDERLEVKLLTLSPRMVAEGLYVGQPEWVSATTPMANVGRLEVAIRLPELLRGRVVLPVLEVVSGTVDLRRQADGRANWTFGERTTTDSEARSLPLIQRLLVADGNVRLRDERLGLDLRGVVESEENQGEGVLKPFKLEGRGTLNGKTFALVLNGGSLLQSAGGQPYPFDMDMTAMRTRVKASGSLTEGLNPDGFEAQVTVSGNDLADLYYLTGLVFPNTPAYVLKGQVVRGGDVVDVKRFDGTIGGSDVRGDIQVNMAGERPRLVADITSRKLDFADLGTLVGAAPVDGKQGGPEGAERPRTSGRLFPDAPLQVERVRLMDAKVTYRAEAVEVPAIPLRRVALDLDLTNGVLKMDPLSFELPQGKASGLVQIDAREDIPVVDIDMRIRGMSLEQFVAGNVGGAKDPSATALPMVEGTLAARVKLRGRGLSVRDAAATADGAVMVVIPRGHVRQAFAELMGTNLSRGLGLLATGNQQQTDIRCGIAHFTAKDGILDNTLFVLDTGVVIAQGKGTVNLRNETLDLTMKGEPKHARLVRIPLPIHVRGTLLKPEVGVDLGQAAGQAGVAVALSSVLTPLAAILPFLDAGLAEDANCRTLMREARKGVAGVKIDASATTPLTPTAPRAP